jgi:lipoprotein-releasing system permease protein
MQTRLSATRPHRRRWRKSSTIRGVNLPYELQIGWRYTRAGKRRNGFISFISAVSIAGIALGVATLIIVLSVMNGFQKEVRDRMLSVLAHIEVYALDGALPNWRATAQQAMRNPAVKAAAPFVAGQALLARGDAMQGAIVRGIDPQLEGSVSGVGKQMRIGSLDALNSGEFNIVLGIDLARSLGVQVGDKVTLVSPSGNVTPAGAVPRMKPMTLVGVFEAGHSQFDGGLALVNIDDAERLFRVENADGYAPSGLRLKIADMLQAPAVAAELQQALGPQLAVRDWTRQNATWFSAVQVEKRMIGIILTLIVAVAAFNLVSTLVMTVTDKQSDIAILRTLGASPRSIMGIFITQGAFSGIVGTLTGVALGCLVAFNIDVIVPFIERLLHVTFLPKDIYLISKMPSDPRMSDIVPITLFALLLAFVATLYPSWRAARTNPAEALRYE